MSIGSRIKHYKEKRNLTVVDLSEVSGINSMLLRKYIKDLTVPKTNQITKIAEALNVSPYALTGDRNHRLLTIGDLYGLLIMLDNIGFILITKNDTGYVSIELNESVMQFFDLRKGLKTQDLHTYNILINDKLKSEDFLRWISKKELLKSCEVNEEDVYYLNLKNEVEELELILQQSTEKL